MLQSYLSSQIELKFIPHGLSEAYVSFLCIIHKSFLRMSVSEYMMQSEEGCCWFSVNDERDVL